MKNVIFTLALTMISTTAFSYEPSKESDIRTITCDSTKNLPVKAVISINQYNVIENIKAGTVDVYTINDNDIQNVVQGRKAMRLVDLSPYMRELRKESGVTLYSKATINLITTKDEDETKNRPEAQLLTLTENRMGGLAFVEFRDSDNYVTGNALITGFAGTFNNCRSN